jgi:hypothetical protein
MNMQQIGRGAAAAGMLAALAGCSSLGSLGSILGSVIPGGGSGASQVSGYVSGVDTRAQVIGLQQPNGQPVNLLFDNQTKVVYNNQSYPVTSLDRGDQITARIQNTNNGYYTDLVQVDQPVRGSAGTTTSSGAVQSVQGTVRQIDQQNGLFTMDVSAERPVHDGRQQRCASDGLDAVRAEPHGRREVPEPALRRRRADRRGVPE